MEAICILLFLGIQTNVSHAQPHKQAEMTSTRHSVRLQQCVASYTVEAVASLPTPHLRHRNSRVRPPRTEPNAPHLNIQKTTHASKLLQVKRREEDSNIPHEKRVNVPCWGRKKTGRRRGHEAKKGMGRRRPDPYFPCPRRGLRRPPSRSVETRSTRMGNEWLFLVGDKVL